MIPVAAKKSFKWSLFIQLSHQVVGFIITLVLARMLSPSDFGVVGLITIFINISKKITDGGLASSLIRTKSLTDRDFSTVFYFNLFCSIFLYSILYFFATYIAGFFNLSILQDLIRVSGITIIISAFTITQSVKLNRSLNFKTQFKILFPSLIVSSIVGIFAANYGFGVWSIVFKEIAFSFLSALQLWYYSKWKPLLVFDKKLFKIHFNFGYKLVLTELISQLLNDSYKAVIGKNISIAQLGYFTRAKSMEELPNQIAFNTVNRVLFPILSSVQEDEKRLKEVYRKIIKLVTFIVIPFLMLMYINAESLFVFLLTSKWLPAVPYFKILIVAGMFAPLQPYLLNICKVKGRSDLIFKLSLVEYTFILLSMLAMFHFGIMGLLWGLVIATLSKLIVAMKIAGQLIGYTIYEQVLDLKDAFLLSGIGYLFSCLFISSKILDGFSPFLILITVSILYYGLLITLSSVFKVKSFYILISYIKKK